MSHIEKKKLFNQLSQNIDPETIRQGEIPLDQFEDWEDILLAFRYSNISLQAVTKLIYEACDLVQEEQQKRIAQKLPRDGNSNLHCAGVKDLIINPENKIQ